MSPSRLRKLKKAELERVEDRRGLGRHMIEHGFISAFWRTWRKEFETSVRLARG